MLCRRLNNPLAGKLLDSQKLAVHHGLIPTIAAIVCTSNASRMK
jgi:hypothetical protein